MDRKASDESPVLIVGAGPTGLALACELARRGVACRVVDQNDGPTPMNESRAMGIQGRTMECFHRMGIADEVLAQARRVHGLSGFSDGTRIVHLTFDFEGLETRYPFLLVLPQSATERLLLARFEALGGSVERGEEVVSIAPDARGVTARFAEGREARASWLVGCDGSRSVVRKSLGLGFEGGEYEERFLIADVKLDWGFPVPDDEMVFLLSPDGPIVGFPFPEAGKWRLVDTSGKVEADGDDAIVARFRDVVTRYGSASATVKDPSWTSSFHIHRRVVDRYRSGRAFVAGDAAHLHSPAGGQGMNTGIQDGVNLAWKLAMVIRGQAPESLLDSYQAERRPVAREVLHGTDLATRAVTLRNPVAKEVRNTLMGVLAEFDFVRRRAARTLSELAIGYPDSPIVGEDHAGYLRALTSLGKGPGLTDLLEFRHGPRPGDRVPDVLLSDDPDDTSPRLSDTFHPTGSTLLLLKGTDHPASDAALSAVGEVANEQGADLMKTVRIPGDLADASNAIRHRFGAKSACVYLVRPDGYIGYRALPPDAEEFRAHLDRVFGPG